MLSSDVYLPLVPPFISSLISMIASTILAGENSGFCKCSGTILLYGGDAFSIKCLSLYLLVSLFSVILCIFSAFRTNSVSYVIIFVSEPRCVLCCVSS